MNTSIEFTHGRDPHLRIAEELSAKARKRWQQAAKDASVVKIGLVVLCVLLAVPTGFALSYLLSWPFVAGYVLALVMHLVLATSVHCLVFGKRVGNRDLFIGGVMGTVLLIIGFLLAAWSRQKLLIEGGMDAILAWIAAFVFWLLEIAGPILLGYILAIKTESVSDAHEESVFFDEHYGLVDAAGDDAAGVWNDQVASVCRRIDRMPGPSSRSLHQENELQKLLRLLETLCTSHPYKRYQFNGNGWIAEIAGNQGDRSAQSSLVTPRNGGS